METLAQVMCTHMQIKEIIEEIVTRELRVLCGTCRHNNTCVYRQESTKAIIQCEIYEHEAEAVGEGSPKRGLCASCVQAQRCTLPGRSIGVWHCYEFR